MQIAIQVLYHFSFAVCILGFQSPNQSNAKLIWVSDKDVREATNMLSFGFLIG